MAKPKTKQRNAHAETRAIQLTRIEHQATKNAHRSRTTVTGDTSSVQDDPNNLRTDTPSKPAVATAKTSKSTVNSSTKTKKPAARKTSRPPKLSPTERLHLVLLWGLLREANVRRVAATMPVDLSWMTIWHQQISRIFALVSLGLLMVTTVFWSLLSARIQQMNSDQLVDAFMFGSGPTFQQAIFPSAHTFLLKWPLFWLIKQLGYTPTAFAIATLALTVGTVGALLWLVWKINRRPAVFGVICLGLASVLLLVPTETYGASLLPVNMAMTTTRNIEYVVYIWCLYGAVSARRIRSWRLAWAVVGMGLLVASDKLFLVLGAGSGLVAVAGLAVFRQRQLLQRAGYWLATAVLGSGLAWVILRGLTSSGLTTIAADHSVSPYATSLSAQGAALGGMYGGMGLLTNFGANPAFSQILARPLAADFAHGFLHLRGVPYAINLVIALAAVTAMLWALRRSLQQKPTGPKHTRPDQAALLTSVMLVLSTGAALGAFVLTNHYFAVDARYLAIVLFAGVVSIATYLKSRAVSARALTLIAIVLALVIPVALQQAATVYEQQATAYTERTARSQYVARTLLQRRIPLLIGNYWLTLPVKGLAARPGQLTVQPTSSCTTPRQPLTSRAWQPDLHTTAFAFLAHRDTNAQTYDGCPMDQILRTYGTPGEIVTLAGDPKQPDEALLLYPSGITAYRAEQPDPQLAAKQDCSAGSVMSVVAHEDDDLLFMNPDTAHAIQDGQCVHIAFLTAGDAGIGRQYWAGREQGAKTAYALLANSDNIWQQADVLVNDHYVSVATLQNNPKVQLLFMRLPDGGIHGNGFAHAPGGHGSLSQLDDSRLHLLQTVDRRSAYSRDELIATLSDLMGLYQPRTVQIQSEHDEGSVIHDHSDHVESGRLALAAYDTYAASGSGASLRQYVGYSVRERDPNVTEDPLFSLKQAAFMAYAHFDDAVCHSVDQCSGTVYEAYIARQYRLE